MAKHNVYVELPWRELGKTDAKFEIRRNGKKLGTITISRGGFDWHPKNSRRPIKTGWRYFDDMIRSYHTKK